MEQIYTIPVNEAFDLSRDDKTQGCPFCTLYRKLQNDELDIILGASMMEPDIRQKTNEQGFCDKHYAAMLKRKRKLGMGLMLESHLSLVGDKLSPSPADLLAGPGTRQLAFLDGMTESCYVCARIERNLSAMIATAVYLFSSDPDFPAKYRAQPYFCLPHARVLLSYAKKKCDKKHFREIYDETSKIVLAYLETLSTDVSWFCKKFDYRYDEEPWYSAKDSVERSISFLTSDTADRE